MRKGREYPPLPRCRRLEVRDAAGHLRYVADGRISPALLEHLKSMADDLAGTARFVKRK